MRLPLMPDYGEPCNGCGYCCREELCEIAMRALGRNYPAPCPLLVERDGRTWCGAVEEAARQNEAFGAHWAYMLGFGAGCLVTVGREESRERALRGED